MQTLIGGRSHLCDCGDTILGKVTVVCHDIDTRTRSTKIIGAWRNLVTKSLGGAIACCASR